MTMDDNEEKVIGVDEVFESFVKKKLKQLGIKRGRAKSPDAISKLEMRMKLRLEKNLANQNSNIKNSLTNQNSSEEKYLANQNSSDHGRRSEPTSENSTDRNSEPLGNHSFGGYNPKKQKIVERIDETFISSAQNTATAGDSCPVISNLQNFESVSSLKAGKPKAADCESLHKPNTSEEKLKISHSKKKHETKSFNHEATRSKFESLPKKDISIIKKKIELLKARSAEAKLKQEIDSTLETVSNKPDSPDREKTAMSDELKPTPEKRSSDKFEAEDRKGKSLKSKKRSREWHSGSKRSGSRHRSHSRSSSPTDKRRHRHRRSRSRSKHRRSRSRERRHRKSRRKSRSPRRITTKDKIKLLEIAKANALAQHRVSRAANSVTSMGQLVREGTLSVSELTNLCEDIVADKPSNNTQGPLTKEKAENMLQNSESTTVHHPYLVKDTPISIKPVRSIPPPPPVVHKPIETLSKEFPVSCGQQHRKKEVMEAVYGKWETVAKDETAKKVIKDIVNSDSVFIQPEKPNLDLSTAICERISAVRELQRNPNDIVAKCRIESAQKALDKWTQSKQIVGQFTGDSKLTPMSRNMLEGGKSAWFKADTLKNAKPVVGIGKSLLQKMGWRPGMSLGKSMPGQLEPLSVEFKTDRRGLSSYMESPAPIQNKRAKKGITEISRDMSNKHPVSALTEVCSKRHWPQPEFRLVDPLSLTIFSYRVIVCKDEYIGSPAANKKEAKKRAATVALQNMGLVPKK